MTMDACFCSSNTDVRRCDYMVMARRCDHMVMDGSSEKPVPSRQSPQNPCRLLDNKSVRLYGSILSNTVY